MAKCPGKAIAFFVVLGVFGASPLQVAQATPMRAFMTASKQASPIATRAIGVATIEYDAVAKILNLESSVLMLGSLDLTAFELQLDHPSAPVLLNIGVRDWTDFSMVSGAGLIYSVDLHSGVLDPSGSIPECIDTAACIAFFENMFFSDRTYLNLGTYAHPGGEVRGQVEQIFPVPEPATLLLLSMGLTGLLISGSRRRSPR